MEQCESGYLRAKPLTLPTKVFPCLKPGLQTSDPYPNTQSDVDSSIFDLFLLSAFCGENNYWNAFTAGPPPNDIATQIFLASITLTLEHILLMFMKSLQGPQRRSWWWCGDLGRGEESREGGGGAGGVVERSVQRHSMRPS